MRAPAVRASARIASTASRVRALWASATPPNPCSSATFASAASAARPQRESAIPPSWKKVTSAWLAPDARQPSAS